MAEPKHDIAQLTALRDRVRTATGADRELDWLLARAFDDVPCGRRYTSSIDAAVTLIERVLPGWWWKCGTCSVSDDAMVAPDRTGPDAHLLDIRLFDEGFNVDARPPFSVPLALLDAMLSALIAKAELEAALGMMPAVRE